MILCKRQFVKIVSFDSLTGEPLGDVCEDGEPWHHDSFSSDVAEASTTASRKRSEYVVSTGTYAHAISGQAIARDSVQLMTPYVFLVYPDSVCVSFLHRPWYGG